MVKVKVVKPPMGCSGALNALLIVGGATTVRVAEAATTVPPLVELTGPVVLRYWPDAAPVTVTLNTHWLLTAIVAPVRVMPVGAVVVNVPPQTVADAFATVNPVGIASLKATPVKATVFAPGLASPNRTLSLP